MNKFIMTGRLTADPDLTETIKGVKVCRFTVAVQRDYKIDGEYKTDFFDVTAWRDLAESVGRYSKKGDKVLVEGSVQPRQYEDNNGTKQKTVDIIAQRVEFLTPKTQSTNTEGEQVRNTSGGERETRLPQQPQQPQQLRVFDDDGDIPF